MVPSHGVGTIFNLKHRCGPQLSRDALRDPMSMHHGPSYEQLQPKIDMDDCRFVSYRVLPCPFLSFAFFSFLQLSPPRVSVCLVNQMLIAWGSAKGLGV